MRHRRYLMLVLAAVTLGSLALAQSGESEKPVVMSAVVPIYPPLAEATRASGDVTVEVEVDREGKVVAANTDSKNTLLSKVAEEAARRWGFAPSQSGEKRRKAQLVFSFRLMPEEASSLDSTPVFYPPYRIEIRMKPRKVVDRPSY